MIGRFYSKGLRPRFDQQIYDLRCILDSWLMNVMNCAFTGFSDSQDVEAEETTAYIKVSPEIAFSLRTLGLVRISARTSVMYLCLFDRGQRQVCLMCCSRINEAGFFNTPIFCRQIALPTATETRTVA
jgi:hypothetical protein